jgi:hypothetical protein
LAKKTRHFEFVVVPASAPDQALVREANFYAGHHEGHDEQKNDESDH